MFTIQSQPSRRSKLLVALVLAATALLGAPADASSPTNPPLPNATQELVVAFGINLGQASATLEQFGRAYGGTLTAQVVADVDVHRVNALAALAAMTGTFPTPIMTSARATTLTQLQDRLENYATNTAQRDYRGRAAYFANVYSAFRNWLSVTYSETRPDGTVTSRVTCDAFLLSVGYFFGRGAIAADIASATGEPARNAASAQDTAVNSLIASINGGLGIAFDGRRDRQPGGRRPEPGVKTVCCYFGAPALWASFDAKSLKQETRSSVWVAKRKELLGLARSIAGGGCGGNISPCTKAERRAHGNEPVRGDWTGTWKTNWGPITLRRTGARITGTYASEKNGRIEGTLIEGGRVLVGRWYKDPGRSGRIRFTLGANGRSFRGDYGENDDEPTSDWNGTLVSSAAPGGNVRGGAASGSGAARGGWAGTWKTAWGEMVLSGGGGRVSGTYGSSGRIEGRITNGGRILEGRWTKSGNRTGRVRLELTADGQGFTGKWGRNDAEPTRSWGGTRMK